MKAVEINYLFSKTSAHFRDRSFFMSMGGLVGFRGGQQEKKNGTKGGGGYQKKLSERGGGSPAIIG